MPDFVQGILRDIQEAQQLRGVKIVIQVQQTVRFYIFWSAIAMIQTGILAYLFFLIKS